ncbi:MAG: secretin N-terminal domain-containing protein [Pseudomonadota bacterium]
MTLFRSLLLTAALCASSLTPAFAADDHIISLQRADIRDFIDDVAVVTGQTFLVDPRVEGQVTISSEQTLNDREVFAVFREVLRVHGYTLIRTPGGEYRVTLLQGSAQDAPLTTANGFAGQMATAIIKLNDADAAEAARLIKPVMHSQGQVTANPNGRVLVVTDFPENLRKAREIAAAMEVSNVARETIGRCQRRILRAALQKRHAIFPTRRADQRKAREIAAAMEVSNVARETIRLTQLSVLDAEEALQQLAGPNPTYRVATIPATNTLIIEGTPEEVADLISRIRAC